MSEHTIGELCNFPKAFYRERFNAVDLTESNAPHYTEKINTFQICSYHSNSKEIGTVYFASPADSPGSATTGQTPVGDLKIDGITVNETQRPTPTWAVAVGPQLITLGATVNHAYGSIEFRALNDQTIQAGAQTLVDMLGTMTK